MSRRRLVVAIAAALAVAVTGCSNPAPPAATEQDDPNGVLEIWIRQAPGSDSEKTAQRLAAAFTSASGIKTHLVAIFDDFEIKVQQQAAQKQLPDIVINDTAQLGNMQQQGWLREVDRSKFPSGDKLADRAWKAAQAGNGKYYAAPFSAQSFALIIRSDWRKKVNLPLPETWDDMVKLARAFTDQDPDGNGKKDTAGFMVPGTTKRGYASWYASSLIWANGGDFLKPAGEGKFKSAVTDPKTVEAVEFVKTQFCTTKTVNPGAVNNDTTITNNAFEKGAGGIYLVGPYVLARFAQNIGTDKLEVAAVPNGPSGGPGTLGEGENVYMTAGSDMPNAQRKFAEFATSPAGQKVGMNGDNPGAIVRLPVNKDVDLGAERKDQRWKVYADAYDKAAVYTPAVPNWAPFRQISADSFNTLWADCGSNVKAGMEALNTKFNDELKKQDALAS